MRRAGIRSIALSALLCTSCGGDSFSSTPRDGGSHDATLPDGGDAGSDASPQPTSSPCPDPTAPSTGNCTTAGACAVAPLVEAPAITDPRHIRSYPFGIAVDHTHVYWAAQDNYDGGGKGAVWRVRKTGGGLERLTEAHVGPHSVVLDSNHVYWVAGWNAATEAPRILRLPKGEVCDATCPEPEVVDQGSPGAPLDDLLLIGEQRLYVVGSTGQYRVEFDGTSWQRSTMLPGGALPTAAFDGKYVYTWVTGDEWIHRTDPDTLLREPFVQISANERRLGSGCNALFSTIEGDAYELTTAQKSGFGSVPIGTTAIRADSRFVYFSVWNAGGIYRLSREGSASNAAKQLAPGNIWGLTLDSDAIYYGEHGGEGPGAIFRITK